MLDSRTVAMDEGVKIGRMRLRIFWITSVGVTIFFLFFVFIMMMVPSLVEREGVDAFDCSCWPFQLRLAFGDSARRKPQF